MVEILSSQAGWEVKIKSSQDFLFLEQGVHFWLTQGLFLALCSGVTLSGPRGNMYGPGDHIGSLCKASTLTHVLSLCP